MKVFLSLLTLVVAITAKTQCLQIPLTLEDKVNHSDLIIEAYVLDSQSEWGENEKIIYTYYTLQPTKFFKGSPTNNQITIKTEGGTVGDIGLSVHPGVKFQADFSGVFFLNKEAENSNFKIYGINQGVYKYDFIKKKAYTVFDSYNLGDDFFLEIASHTGQPPATLSNLPDHITNVGNIEVQSVSSVTPLNVTAGTGATITINGSNFGATQGTSTVMFTNANSGGAAIDVEAENYTSWSDTQIVVEVPSDAGSGQIEVQTAGATFQSSESLIINFSRINYSVGSNVFTTAPYNQNSLGGHTWVLDSDFVTVAGAEERFREAIQQWTCNSEINWQISQQTEDDLTVDFDNRNAVFFTTQAETGGSLGVCYNWYGLCGTDYDNAVTFEYDIIFNEELMYSGTDFSWNFELDSPSSTEFDFFSVALHEIGHAHQQGHIIESSSVMHYNIFNGATKRTLATGEIQGAIDVVQDGVDLSACAGSHTPLGISAAQVTNDVCASYEINSLNDNIWHSIFESNGELVMQVNPLDNVGSIDRLVVELYVGSDITPDDGNGNAYLNRLVTINAYDSNDDIVDPLPGDFLVRLPYMASEINAILTEEGLASVDDLVLVKNDLNCGEAYTYNQSSNEELSFSRQYSSCGNYILQTSTSSFSSFSFAGAAPIPLPVKWDYFTAVILDSTIELEWRTLSESNSSYFDVERKTDFSNDWESLFRVSAAGQSSSPIVYSGFDDNPALGINYYRLKQVDIDGATEYSDIRQIHIEDVNLMKVIQNTVYVKKEGNFSLSVYELTGQKVEEFFGANNASYDLGNLSTGMYFIRLMDTSGRVVKIDKLIVK